MEQDWPVLYQRAPSGKLKRWEIRVEKLATSQDSYDIITSSGYTGYKMTSSNRTITSGKNIGRKNIVTLRKKRLWSLLELLLSWKVHTEHTIVGRPNQFGMSDMIIF